MTLALVLSGCSTSLSRSDVIGTYKDNNPLGVSTLVLKADGTFHQVLITKTGKKYTAAGKWSFDSTDSHLQMDNALSYADFESSGRPLMDRMDRSYAVEKPFPKVNPRS